MGWKEFFGIDRSVKSSSRIDNNYNDYDRKYKTGWSATSSWTSKIPGFSGFRSFSLKDNCRGEALDDALPVLCNSISLFDANAKIQWSFNESNVTTNNTLLHKFLRHNVPNNNSETVVLLNPDLIIENATDSTALTQSYDALIGDAIMGGAYMKRLSDMENVLDFSKVYAVLCGRILMNNHNSQLCVQTSNGSLLDNFPVEKLIKFNKTSLSVSLKDPRSNIVQDGSFTVGRKITFGYTFSKEFGKKFGKEMSFKFNNILSRSAINLFSACEQKHAEISICEKFRGATSYIFASHKVCSPDKVRKLLRKNLANSKPKMGFEDAFVSIIVDAILWNLINQNDQLFGNPFTKALIQFVMSNLLPSLTDLPDVSLAKCVYIVKFIQDAVKGNDVFDDKYDPSNGEDQGENEGNDQGQGQGEDEGDDQGQGQGEDQGEGEDEGDDEGQGQGEDQGEGEDEGDDEGQGNGNIQSMDSADGEENESSEMSQGEKSEENVAISASKPTYSNDDISSNQNWNSNIRNFKLPLTALDALNDLKKSIDGFEFDMTQLGIYHKDRNHVGVSASLSAFTNTKQRISGYELHGATQAPIAVNDNMAIKTIQFNGANKMRTYKIVCNAKDARIAYNKIATKHRSYIDMIRERLRVRSIGTKGEEYSKFDGVLDEGNIWQLYDTNNEQIFMQENQPKVVEKAHISVLIDASGSMGGTRIDMVKELGTILSTALHGVHGVEFKMFGHAGQAIYDFNNDNHNATEEITMMPADGGTAEGEAMQYVLRESDRHRMANMRDGERTNYYLFVLGDGASNVSEIHKALKMAQDCAIKICHLGIDNAYDAGYGDKTYGNGRYVILPSDAVIPTMVTAITKLLTL